MNYAVFFLSGLEKTLAFARWMKLAVNFSWMSTSVRNFSDGFLAWGKMKCANRYRLVISAGIFKGQLFHKIEFNSKLNRRLEQLLSDWGIGVGALSELEEKQGINGITDFDCAITTANGLKTLIRVVNDDAYNMEYTLKNNISNLYVGEAKNVSTNKILMIFVGILLNVNL